MGSITKDENDKSICLDVSHQNRLFFITTQRNLMSFLGAGMVVPSMCQFRYKEDSRMDYDGAIPFWKGGTPSNSKYTEMLKDERVVIIEYHIDDIMKYGGRYIVKQHKGLIAVNAPIPLLSVTKFHLHSNKAIEEFIIRVPDDVILDQADFTVIQNINPLDLDFDAEMSLSKDIEPTMTFIDAFGGGIKALFKFMKNNLSDHRYIYEIITILLENFPDRTDANNNKKLIKVTNSDKAILLILIPILQNIKPENGFDQIYIINQLKLELKKQNDDIAADIEQWIEYAQRAVEAEVEVPALADERDIFKRAVLLFLLRPDLNRLENAENSSISPGPIVLSIAALLAGFTSGLTRMGSEYKGNFREFNIFTKSLLDSLWCKSSCSLSIVKEFTPDNGAYQIFEVNKEILFKIKVQQNIVLARVLNQAKLAGYDLEYNYEDDELKFECNIGNNRHQIIHIELMTPLSPGFDLIRFVSPCLDLSGKNLRLLKKDVAVDLLKRNNESSMYCNFAYSERRKAIVVEAKQIVRTMDDDEFITLLNHVAKSANEYKQLRLDMDS